MYNVDKNREELDKIPTNSPYHGQWDTDKIIEEYFPGKEKGICIEVGAANGVRGSNTKYFEDLGWDVLCLEPNKLFAHSLERDRKLVRYYAVGETNEEKATLQIFSVGKKNIMSSLTSLKPDPRLVDDHLHLINDITPVEVSVRTLTHIIENHVQGTPFDNVRTIDFVSIDTEGTELDVLKGFDFKKHDVKLFVVENNYSDPEIAEYMETKGYVLSRRFKINDFYIKA